MILKVHLRQRDHFFSWGWWSEPWAAKMVHEYVPIYNEAGSTFETSDPPSDVRVMIDGRSQGTATLFSSRCVKR